MTGTPVDPAAPIRVLIAEDETHLGTILEQFMTARGFAVRIVRDGRAALEALRTDAFDVALLDVVMPEVDGLEVLRLVREEPLPPEIIVITGNGTIETAIAALKLGAYDFLSKPYRMAEIEALVRRAWEKRMLARENHRLASRLARIEATPAFHTRFAPLRSVLAMVEKMAPSPSPVLITGEQGTGKAHLARILHRQGMAPEAPFVSLSCRADRTTLEEELRGVERVKANCDGAPGVARRLGVFELAGGGTLHLADVELLDAGLQALLLEIIEHGQVTRIGGDAPVDVGVRLVTSTTQDLDARVRSGQFSEALLHRLNAIRITLPPLRERRTDIPLLAQHFAEASATGVAPRLSDDAVAMLEQYEWPGNVSELRHVIERATRLSNDGTVSAATLSFGASPSSSQQGSDTLTLAELERRHIADVLDRTGWHQGRAAEVLGISPKTLYRKIREYGFKRPSGRAQ